MSKGLSLGTMMPYRNILRTKEQSSIGVTQLMKAPNWGCKGLRSGTAEKVLRRRCAKPNVVTAW